MNSQTGEILNYLRTGKTITASYAITRFRCYRLAARIYDLRRLGFNVESSTVRRKSKRTGRIIAFAEYFIPNAAKSRRKTNKEGLVDYQSINNLLEYNPHNGFITWKKTNSMRVIEGSRAETDDSNGYLLVYIGTIPISRIESHG